MNLALNVACNSNIISVIYLMVLQVSNSLKSLKMLFSIQDCYAKKSKNLDNFICNFKMVYIFTIFNYIFQNSNFRPKSISFTNIDLSDDFPIKIKKLKLNNFN